MSEETRDESTETTDTEGQDTQDTGTDEAGEGQATEQRTENKGTQGQPTTAEDGVEHNQHIETPEETADREAGDESSEVEKTGAAGQVEEPSDEDSDSDE